MTEPNLGGLDMGQAAAAAATIQALKDNAERLGLVWQIRPATVVTADPVTAMYDGDSEAIAMTPMIGNVYVGQRVYVFIVPPSGNYIAGVASGSTPAFWQYRRRLAATTTNVSLAIPAGLRNLVVRWKARSTLAATYGDLRMTINGVVGAFYPTQYLIGQGAAAGAAQDAGGVNSAFVGWVAGATATANRFSTGQVELNALDISGLFLGHLFQSQVMGAVGGAIASYGGGDVLAGVGFPYASVQLFPNGGSFVTNSDFQMLGEY